ncbi:MAG: hypothetical protein K8T90_18400 [Planctomycetes bacterium]|nr:hypothetical protein [Planctomycetota bacterium]
MRTLAALLVFVVAACAPGGPIVGSADVAARGALQSRLAVAQREHNSAEIARVVAETRAALGDSAGVPDEETKYDAPPRDVPRMSADERRAAFRLHLAGLREQTWRWGRTDASAGAVFVPPTKLPGPLRAIAETVTGCLAARRAGCDDAPALLDIATRAGEYMLWAQAQGGRGAFPVPDLRAGEGRVPDLVRRFLARAEAEGRLGQVLVNGWIVDDGGGGDLAFDNGLCGVAMLELHAATGERRWLDAAQAAADWAAASPAVPNWNYNAFSVFLLAETFRASRDPARLAAAKEKALLGVLPGQIRDGPHAGRWLDAHNARPVYHFILVRGLASLVSVLPADDPDLPAIRACLAAAVRVRCDEIVSHGVPNLDTTIDVLSRLAILAVAQDAGAPAAFDVAGRYVTAKFRRRGAEAVGPAAWGLWLEALHAAEPR